MSSQSSHAHLISAEFRSTSSRRADLTFAEFYGAKLQGAHLDGTRLSGARFDDANVTETFFYGALLSETALKSLLGSKVIKGTPSWKRAYFDAAAKSRLEQLATRP